MSKIRELFGTFFKIGAFTFGGGYAMVALLEHEFVEEKRWLTREEFLDMVAIAESTPGPVAVNSATYIGYKLAGVAGAAVSTLAVCLPSFAVIYLISLFFDRFLQLTVVANAFKGIQACVIYLILSAGIKMLKNLQRTPFNTAVVAVVLLCVLALPQLAASLKSIGTLVRENWPDWARLLSDHGVDTSELTDRIAALDWKTVLEKALTGAGALIDSVVDLAGTTVSAVANVTFAIVIMFYVLLDRRSLAKQSRRLLYANLSERKADQVCRIARLTHTTYARFLSGQCVEVVILGTMIFLAFSLCGIPYAGLTAALTAAFAFVPYIGALASCAIGVLLTLLAQPEKALLCLIVYQAVQFTENQFIYPHVVGSSVGLAPLWTLLAALLGGKLFGLVGIVFFIPLTAVVLQLVHEHTAQQLSEKKLDREDLIE